MEVLSLPCPTDKLNAVFFTGEKKCSSAAGRGAKFAVTTFAKVIIIIIMYKMLCQQILLQGCSWEFAVVGKM